MKIPENMTQSEVLAIIQKIANRYKSLYKFNYYEEDDIQQECFIFALEGLEKYNGSSPLENFLAVHIRNRLLSLKRNKLSRTLKESNKFDKIKRLIAQPIDIAGIDDENESNMSQSTNLLDIVSYDEIKSILDKELEVEYRMGFLKLLEGKSLTKFHRDRIINRVREILSKYET